MFNFVYGFKLLDSSGLLAFGFGSRRTQEGDGTIHDSIVEKGVKHFHLSSSKKIIHVFAGVMHVKMSISSVSLPIQRYGKARNIRAVNEGSGGAVGKMDGH